ncbi:MAG: alpha/beta fold hydrolase [Psychromonas sp.]
MKERIEFTSNNTRLAGLLEHPSNNIKAYVLFAHCFTCSKDIAAASHIASALVKNGFAVLRFDFTGLGNSDGDFSNSNFSSNLEDLRAAAAFLRENYAAPSLLIGHSLGGAAVLSVANDIPEVKAVVTIAAPATAEHVIHNFQENVDQINHEGYADVLLGARKFTIKKQFIDDLTEHSKAGFMLQNKALLVMHSPMDTLVSISEAEKIYSSAKHPKSFISLDKADHLLTAKADSQYVASVISGWADKYIEKQNVEEVNFTKNGSVVVSERDHKFTLNVVSDSHFWLADEPLKMGGKNLGPDPYEHLLAALGACTVMTIRMYATLKKINLDDVQVTLSHDRNYIDDSQHCEGAASYAEQINRKIKLIGDLSAAQKQRLLEIADKCPVHKTLHNKVHVNSVLDEE